MYHEIRKIVKTIFLIHFSAYLATVSRFINTTKVNKEKGISSCLNLQILSVHAKQTVCVCSSFTFIDHSLIDISFEVKMSENSIKIYLS